MVGSPASNVAAVVVSPLDRVDNKGGGVAGDLGVVMASVVTILVLDMEAFH